MSSNLAEKLDYPLNQEAKHSRHVSTKWEEAGRERTRMWIPELSPRCPRAALFSGTLSTAICSRGFSQAASQQSLYILRSLQETHRLTADRHTFLSSLSEVQLSSARVHAPKPSRGVTPPFAL